MSRKINKISVGIVSSGMIQAREANNELSSPGRSYAERESSYNSQSYSPSNTHTLTPRLTPTQGIKSYNLLTTLQHPNKFK